MEKPNKDNKQKRARLIDVAREAGVSVQAASHVMSGNMTVRIPETTRNRVREAAKKVGYVPNKLAQAMKTGRSGIIALWIPLDRASRTYVEMLQRLSDKARVSGYGLMIINIDRDLAYKGTGPAPDYWPVDGVIAIDSGKAIQTFRDNPANDDTPVAILALEEFSNSDTIGWDVCGGVKSAVERTIKAGKKHIVHVSPEWILNDYPREQRRRGYTEAMTEAGLTPILVSSKTETAGAAQTSMEEYIQKNGVPEAILGFLDPIALGAARAVLATGKKIPEDCWVIGMGDTAEGSEFSVPLTTLNPPIKNLIDQTWEWLLDRIGNTKQIPRKVILPMDLIERQSTDFPTRP